MSFKRIGWTVGLIFCVLLATTGGCNDEKQVRTERKPVFEVVESEQPTSAASDPQDQQSEEAFAEEPAKEEPLLLLEEEPLLLSEEEDTYDGPVADNSRCHVCHLNFDGEDLTKVHARAEIGCEDCHGASDAHCSDEDNITPPDRMFATDTIVDFCTECHAEEGLKDVPAHDQVFEGDKVCTDCHGNHRLNVRTRRWNEKTGELIEDDNVRMLTDEMLEDSQ